MESVTTPLERAEVRPGLGTEARGIVREVLVSLALGTFFGIVLIQSEVVSWYRIQEMFRFQSFHMYGVIGSAVVTAALALAVLRRFKPLGDSLRIPAKDPGRGYRLVLGGTTFGLGWGLTGACPGPTYALIGYGIGAALVVLASALAGTWTYATVRSRLPH